MDDESRQSNSVELVSHSIGTAPSRSSLPRQRWGIGRPALFLCSLLLVEADPDYRTVDTPPEIQSLNWPESPAPRPWLAGVTARPTDVRVPVLYVRGASVGGNSAINAAGAVRRVPGALMFGGDRAGRAPRLLGVRVGPGQR